MSCDAFYAGEAVLLTDCFIYSYSLERSFSVACVVVLKGDVESSGLSSACHR